MRTAIIHLVRTGRNANARLQTKSEYVEPRLSTTFLSDPAEILRRMPTQAITPALLELLDLMASPIYLIENSPVGELRERAPAVPALPLAA